MEHEIINRMRAKLAQLESERKFNIGDLVESYLGKVLIVGYSFRNDAIEYIVIILDQGMRYSQTYHESQLELMQRV